MSNDNKEGYERRMAVVKEVICGFGLEIADITPLRWDADQTWPYNNYIYKVTLSSPALAKHFTKHQPCTNVLPSDGVSTLVLRLSNPRALGMNNTNRVENEVAAMHIARDAVAKAGYTDIVPVIYAWKAHSELEPADETGFGWVLMESMAGTSLSAHFKTLDMDGKKALVREIAAVFSAMQAAEIPAGVDRFGGLTINSNGEIVSGQETMQSEPAGPWREYDDVWKYILQSQLKQADESEVIKGWKQNGLRERVDTFINTALGQVIKDGGVDTSKLTFVHLDFTMSNMLYDTEKKRITAMLDFDWAAVTHPGHEFLSTSLHDIPGSTFGQESEKLKEAILTGDFSAGKDDSEQKLGQAWSLAQTWSDAVKALGGMSCSDVSGMKTLHELNTFADSCICPWELGNADMIKQRSAEENEKARAEAEKALDEMLRKWGV